MAFFTEEIVYSLLLIITCLIIEIFLGVQTIRGYFSNNHPKILLVFFMTFLILILRDFTFFVNIFTSELNIFLYINLQKVHYIAFILVAYSLFLFIEVFEHNSIFTKQQMIMTVLFTVLVMIILLGNLNPVWIPDVDYYLDSLDFIPGIWLTLLTSFVGIIILLNLRIGYKGVWITQKKQLKYFILGLVLVFFIPLIIVLFLFGNSVDSSLLLKMIIRIPSVIGCIIFYLSFRGFKYNSLFNRQKADKILVTNLNGIPLFDFDFKNDPYKIDAILFSGAMVAITQVMLESIKSSSPIAEVRMKNQYRLMLEFRTNFLALILTPRGGNYLRSSLEEFAEAFEENFSSIIASGEVLDVGLFARGARTILTSRFGLPWQELPKSEE